MNFSRTFPLKTLSFAQTNQNLESLTVLNSSFQDSFLAGSQSQSSSSSTFSWQQTEVEAILTRFARSRQFFQVLRTAFGTCFSREKTQNLRRQWSTGNFSDRPELQIQTADELNGAVSAFSTATNTIYLSQDYIDRYAGERDALTGVLLEEFGHFIDSEINASDAPGDEGAIFAALLQGVNLSKVTLNA